MTGGLRRLGARVLDVTDGPTLLSDMATLGSPLRVSLWFSLLNLVLGGIQGGMIYWASSGVVPFGIASQELGLGQFLAGTLLHGLGGVLTLLIPLRAAGAFEVPRWGKYFDQVVMTGISPSRYIGGKLVANNVFFWLVIAASLPYAIFCLALGGTQASYVFKGVLALWIYANVLTIFTVAFGAFFNEIAAVLSSVSLFGGMYLLALAPLPPSVGAIVPSHALAVPFWTAMRDVGEAPLSWSWQATVVLFGQPIALDSFQVFVCGSAVAGVLALAAAILGPARCLVGETSAFGEVVMDGDSRKAGVFRRHGLLRRRSEMAFFYENRGEWLARWEAPLRYGWVLACLVIPAWIGWASLFGATVQARPHSWHAGNMALFGAVLAFAAMAFSGDRSVLRTRLGAGPWRPSVALLNALGFAAVCVGVTAIAYVVPLVLESQGAMGWRTDRGDFARDRRLGRQVHALLPLGLVMAAQYYALLSLLAARVWQRGSAVLAAGAGLGMIWLVPFGAALTLADYYRFSPALMPQFVALSELSPLPLVALMAEARGRFTTPYLRLAEPTRTIYYQLALMVVLVFAAGWGHARLVRSATGVAGDDGPEAAKAPAAESAAAAAAAESPPEGAAGAAAESAAQSAPDAAASPEDPA